MHLRPLVHRLSTIFVLASFLCACSTAETETAQDPGSLTILGTSPGNGATNVAVNTIVGAFFTGVVDAGLITDNTFAVAGPTGKIPGTVNAIGYTLEFIPMPVLAYNTTYTATIAATVKDTTGRILKQDYVWSFTTGDEPDLTPPTISSVTPPSGAAAVGADGVVRVTFSEEMDSPSITPTTFFISGPLGPIAGTIEYGGTVATFTPAQDLASDTTYAISVTTGVLDRAGNHLVADYTSTFTTIAQAKKWGIPTSIEGFLGDASDVRVGMDPHSNGIAIWGQQSTTGGTPSLWFNRYLTNGGWQGANRIETDLGVVPWVGAVACDKNGNIFVVWEESTGLGGDFYGVSVRRYDASTGQWGPSRSLTEVSGRRDTRRNPKLAVDESGNAFVVWEDSSGLGVGIVYVNRYDQATASWSGKEVLADFAFEPEVAVDQFGNGVVIWAQHSHSVDGIYVRRYGAATSLWTPAEHLSNDGIFYAGSPQLTVSPAGDVIVVWIQADQITLPSLVWTNRFEVSLGQWEGPDVFTSTDVSAENPAIGSDHAGNTILVWQRDSNAGLWATRYVSGVGWDTPILLIDAPPLAQLAVDGDGNAIIVGSLANVSFGGPFLASIYAMHYAVGDGWGPRVQIGGSGSVASFPQVVTNQGGNAIVVWLQQGADFTGPWDVWANRFE